MLVLSTGRAVFHAELVPLLKQPCSTGRQILSKLIVGAMRFAMKILSLWLLSGAAALSLQRTGLVSLARAVPSSRGNHLHAVFDDKLSRRSVLLGTASLATALAGPRRALADDSTAAPRAGYSSSADEKAARLKAQQDAFKAELAARGANVASSPSSSPFAVGLGGTSEPTAEELARAEKKREQKAIYKAAMEKAKAGRVDGPGLAGTGIFKAPF